MTLTYTNFTFLSLIKATVQLGLQKIYVLISMFHSAIIGRLHVLSVFEPKSAVLDTEIYWSLSLRIRARRSFAIIAFLLARSALRQRAL